MATREREKSLKRRENKDKRPRAVAKYVRISSRKVKVVIDLIRGKQVGEARAILLNTPKAASEPVIKVLDSAVANAENNLDMVKDSLYLSLIHIFNTFLIFFSFPLREFQIYAHDTTSDGEMSIPVCFF